MERVRAAVQFGWKTAKVQTLKVGRSRKATGWVLHLTLICSTSYCLALHYIELSCFSLHCIALHCVVVPCIALSCLALHCIVLYCIEL